MDISEDQIKAFLADLEEVNKKHKLRLAPVLNASTAAITAVLNVEEIKDESEKPEADKPADKGDKATEGKGS